MKLWYVPDLHSEWGEDDGWYVVADTPSEARTLIITEREANWREAFEEHKVKQDFPSVANGMSEAEYRVWYFTGVHYKGLDATPDPDSFVGEPDEVTARVVKVPFLGYTW